MESSTVQKYRDGEYKHFKAIIEYHLPIIDKVIAKYTCPQYSFDDLQEIAYYELTLAVKKAQTKLYDNNITPYLIKQVTYRILSHLTLDTLMVYKKTKAITPGRMSRNVLIDYADTQQSEAHTRAMLYEEIRKAIHDERQYRIVMYKLQGYTFKEISKLIPGTYTMLIHREWSAFVKRLVNAYSDI